MQDYDIVVYTDGSHAGGSSGLGMAICHHGKVEIMSAPWDGFLGSAETEFVAAAEGLEQALSVASTGMRVLMVVDFSEVARYVSEGLAGPKSSAVAAWLEPVLETARLCGVHVDALAVKGHGLGVEDYSGRHNYLNGVADCLARLGRRGRRIRFLLEDDEALRDRIVAASPRLCPEATLLFRRTCTASEAAKMIGVKREVVDRLIGHGYLHVVPEVSRISLTSVKRVAREAARLRKDRERAVEAVPAPAYGFAA